jgi:hypothetical protein
MISGEAGLEKSNLAALIHYSSPDKDRPMVKVGHPKVAEWRCQDGGDGVCNYDGMVWVPGLHGGPGWCFSLLRWSDWLASR